jgi:dCMP deaminase
MENRSLLDWHSMFMGVALLAAARSKDARKRNGACIASADYKILGVGYNGLPRGCDDDDPAYWADIDSDPLQSRHSYIVHAEVNAILNCVVLPLTGGTIYATQFPCPRCVQSIIQVGIRRVVYLEQKPHQVHRGRQQDAARCRHPGACPGRAGARVADLVGPAGAVHPQQPRARGGRAAARRHLGRIRRPFPGIGPGAAAPPSSCGFQSPWTSATRRWTP